MKHILKLSLILFTILISGCSKAILIEDIIDLTAPFELNLLSTNDKGLTESNTVKLEVNAKKWNKLVEWGNSNKEDWQFTVGTFIRDVYVSQDNFKLLYTKDSNGVIIEFIDDEGEPKQLSKKIGKGELNFLLD